MWILPRSKQAAKLRNYFQDILTDRYRNKKKTFVKTYFSLQQGAPNKSREPKHFQVLVRSSALCLFCTNLTGSYFGESSSNMYEYISSHNTLSSSRMTAVLIYLCIFQSTAQAMAEIFALNDRTTLNGKLVRIWKKATVA
jgi:hypothetical protein